MARSGSERRPPSKASGLLYGLGLGGFVDGIVLHQVFQWHHMVSDVGDYPTTTVAGLEVNTLADGFFHLATCYRRGLREVETAALEGSAL